MANRKLQTEIDRTLKKVQEGIEVFDQLYNKVYSAPTPQQKEKYEADLKKEIKKLQRYRDQIKTWAGSSEVKDKSPLLEARRTIEQDMERFKVCEKETKTKAFSKEGLAQAVKKDPLSEARDQAREWLEQCVEQIEQQKETVEAELESLGGGKKKKSNQGREDELREVMDRHLFHTTNLEQLLRLLDNESIAPTDIDEIKDGVEYYIESNMDDPDFYDDDTIYDDIKALAEIKDNPDATIAVAGLQDEEPEPDPDPEPAPKKEEPAKPKQPEPKPAKEEPPAPAQPQSARNQQPSLPIPLPTPLPQPTPQHNQQAQQARAQQQAQAQARAQAQAQAQALAAAQQVRQQPVPDYAQLKQNLQREEQERQRQQQLAQQQAQRTGAQVQQPQNAAPHKAHDDTAADAMARRGSLDSLTPIPGVSEAELVEDPHVSVERSDDTNPLQMLDASFRNIPDPSDSERPKNYVPRNAYPTHTSFPDKPLPLFENPAMFEKLDIDTLFFIFYYQQGTYQQYLAARELKKQSWRFHKKYMTWFQRHEEPKVTTDEYEQGTYVYFDFETGWCQRIKSEFTFEYSYLEDELQI